MEIDTNLTIDGRDLELGNLDKVMYPGEELTKSDVVDYYRRIADHLLPWVRGRPLVMRRFPDGIGDDGFFQKNRPDYFPEWIESITLEKSNGDTHYVLCQDAATLVYLADQAVLEPHVWLSRASRPRHPDHLIFDLDPSRELDDGGLDDVRAAARALSDVFDDLGVSGFVKSTGSRGLHVHLPLDPDDALENDEASDLALAIAERVVEIDPERFTVEQRTSARGQRLFLDTLRMHYAQHAVAPYGLRARPGAPVAVPLDWEEALRADFHPRAFTITNIFRRLAQKVDPWRGFWSEPIGGSALRALVS